MVKLDGKILIVDDMGSTREMLRKAVAIMGFKKIDEAANGRVGLEKIRASAAEKKPYRLAFFDINMPEVDGLQLLDQIRQDATTRDLPVIVVTTESAKPVVIRAVMSGISGYIVKPFTNEEIYKKVVEIFERAADNSL